MSRYHPNTYTLNNKQETLKDLLNQESRQRNTRPYTTNTKRRAVSCAQYRIAISPEQQSYSCKAQEKM